jgi:hypothetical protein
VTPEELAHWHYRRGAITRELDRLRQTLRDGVRLQMESRIAGLREKEAEQGYSATVEQVEASLSEPTYIDHDIERIGKYIKFHEYLLEEAHYKIELGKVYRP